MNIEEIDAALSLIRQEPKMKQGTKVLLSLETTTYVLDVIGEALTTLRDLKRELKEVGDMPNTVQVYKNSRHHLNIGSLGVQSTQYTRTTPTLKKILGDL